MPMIMEERLAHAKAALKAYFDAKDEPRWDRAEIYYDTDASDLIADLLHLQKHLGHDVDNTLMRAEMHFEAEQAEQAGIDPDATDSVITIEVKGGMVTDVSNLPDGWRYQVNDLDER